MLADDAISCVGGGTTAFVNGLFVSPFIHGPAASAVNLSFDNEDLEDPFVDDTTKDEDAEAEKWRPYYSGVIVDTPDEATPGEVAPDEVTPGAPDPVTPEEPTTETSNDGRAEGADMLNETREERADNEGREGAAASDGTSAGEDTAKGAKRQAWPEPVDFLADESHGGLRARDKRPVRGREPHARRAPLHLPASLVGVDSCHDTGSGRFPLRPTLDRGVKRFRRQRRDGDLLGPEPCARVIGAP